MPKLYPSKEISKVLHILGYLFISQKGSHGKLKMMKESSQSYLWGKKKYLREHYTVFYIK